MKAAPMTLPRRPIYSLALLIAAVLLITQTAARIVPFSDASSPGKAYIA